MVFGLRLLPSLCQLGGGIIFIISPGDRVKANEIALYSRSKIDESLLNRQKNGAFVNSGCAPLIYMLS